MAALRFPWQDHDRKKGAWMRAASGGETVAGSEVVCSVTMGRATQHKGCSSRRRGS